MIDLKIWTAEHPNVIVPCEKFIDMVVTHDGKFYEGMLTEVERK